MPPAMKNRVIKIFLTSSQTWFALSTTVILVSAFIQWFSPSMPMLLAVLAAGILLVLMWPAIFFRSDVFQKKYRSVPEEIETVDLENLLQDCTPSFRKPAMACLILARKIHEKFKTQAFHDEVNSLLQHLAELAVNHKELLERSREFGTDEQKQAMERLLQQQAETVEASLSALKRFSGNLTLFDLHFKDQKEIDGEIKAINLGLQEAIREIQHE